MAMPKQWNPMEDAFKNKNFNKYEQGPGAELDENLQPGAMAWDKTNSERRYQLCLKSVPAEMEEKAIRNLCSNYGKVTNVRQTDKTPFVFVSFPTLNDMERALEGINSEKPQGIFASIAKNTQQLQNSNQQQTHTHSSNSYGGSKGDRDRTSDSDGTNHQPDLSRRSIKGPFTNPPRKNFGDQRKPFVTEDDYKNSSLKDVDPDRTCLVSQDIHDKDRNNIRGNQQQRDQQGGRQMHTGRAYYKDSKETTDNLQKLSGSSAGSYDAEKSCKKFEEDAAAIQYCVLCKSIANKVCQRCGDFYCSVDCQRKDWSRHRLFCFPMPELIAPVNIPIAHTPIAHTDVPKTTKLNDSFEKQSDKVRTASQSSSGQGSFQQKNNSGYGNRNDDYSEQNGGSGAYNRQNNKPMNNRGGLSGNSDRNQGRDQGKTQNHGRDQGKTQNQGRNLNSSFESNKKEQNKNNPFENKNNPFENKKPDAFTKTSEPASKFASKPNPKTSETSSKFAPKPIPKSDAEKAEAPKNTQPPKIQRAELPKSGSLVAITVVIKPNHMYVRSLASEDNVDYVKTINLVNNEAKKSKPLEQMPKRGDLAVTDFQGEGYYRVLVLNDGNKDKIQVAYIDFGNVDFKKLSELKEIPPQVIALKRHTLPIKLKGVPDFEPLEKITEYLNSYVDAVGKELRLVYGDSKVNGQFEFELIDIATNESLNKKVNELRDIKVPALDDEPVFMKDIPVNLIPAGENVPLIVLDTSLIMGGSISCVHESDLPVIEKMTGQFTEYVKKTTGPYTPRSEEICLVQYEDDAWYRAECIEVVGDQNPSVLFIDFGNLTTAHISKIRRYPKELIVPSVTVTCWIDGLPENNIDPKLTARLKELVPMNEKIIAKKVEVSKDENVIHLPEVLNTVKAEKLL